MRKLVTIPLFVIIFVLLGGLPKSKGNAGSIAGQAEQQQAGPNQRTDSANPITLPEGTTISIRIADVVNSDHNHAGDLITGTVDPSVFVDNQVVIPRGTEAHMRVMEDRKGGHLHGKATLSLELVGLVINKEKLDVDSDDYRKKQGAVSAKLKNVGTASASSGTSAATSPTPEGGVVGPIIAVFRSAKIKLDAGTRVPFTLTTPFTFEQPNDSPAQPHSSGPPE